MSFLSPSVPKVPKVEALPDPNDTEARSAAAAEMLKRRNAAGRASTILGGGINQPRPQTSSVVLLGQ